MHLLPCPTVNHEQNIEIHGSAWGKDWPLCCSFIHPSIHLAYFKPCSNSFHKFIVNLYAWFFIGNYKPLKFALGEVTHFLHEYSRRTLTSAFSPWQRQFIAMWARHDWTWKLPVGTWDIHSFTNPVWGTVSIRIYIPDRITRFTMHTLINTWSENVRIIII